MTLSLCGGGGGGIDDFSFEEKILNLFLFENLTPWHLKLNSVFLDTCILQFAFKSGAVGC